MRVDNWLTDATSGSGLREEISGSSRDRATLSASGQANATDQISLSGAVSLGGLAKGLFPTNRAGKFAEVQAAVNAGQYRMNSPAISKAVVNEHLTA